MTIHTTCAHCGDPLRLTVDSALRVRVGSAGAEPLLFEPVVEWATFTESNILDAY